MGLFFGIEFCQPGFKFVDVGEGELFLVQFADTCEYVGQPSPGVDVLVSYGIRIF